MATNKQIVLYQEDIIRLDNIRIFIDQNLSQDLSISRLSKEFMISARTLQRHYLFRYGEPIAYYVRRKRMSLAMLFLIARSMPISQIGITVGYNDRTAFTRTFVKFFFHPPAYFSKSNDTNSDLAQTAT